MDEPLKHFNWVRDDIDLQLFKALEQLGLQLRNQVAIL
jgi:hypothetical protein